MIKKIIFATVLSLMLSVSAFAAQADNDAVSESPQFSKENPENRGEHGDMPDMPGGGRGREGQPPEPPRMDGTNENADVNIAAPQQPSENGFAGNKDFENKNGENKDVKNNNDKFNDENIPEIPEKGGFDAHKQNVGETENDVDVPELSVNNDPETLKDFISFIKAYATPIISLILLALAFVFVKFYK